MLFQLLIVVAIVAILVAGPRFDNILITISFYGGLICGAIAAFWYSGKLSGGIADFFLGGSGGTVDQNLALADKYEHERDYQKAIDLYQKVIKKNKQNPTPRLKLAELHRRLQNYDMYLLHMSETLRACRNIPMSERCAIINRMADTYLKHKNDRAAAVKILSHIINEFPDSRYAGYARERIAGLK